MTAGDISPACPVYDLLVVGGGPGGESAALHAAALGKRVALIERRALGGAPVNTAGVPSKALREVARRLTDCHAGLLPGASCDDGGPLRLTRLLEPARRLGFLERRRIRARLHAEGVHVVAGRAQLAGRHQVQVTSRGGHHLLAAEYIVLAPGASPHRPAGIVFDGQTIVDSDQLLRLERVPRSLAVVGGGVIGAEYASVFAALGSAVTLLGPDAHHSKRFPGEFLS